MKGMILAAGLGERMRPLTNHLPKPLLDFRGKPLIGHAIDRFIEAGIEEIVINVCYLADQIVNTVNALYQDRITLHYSYEETPLNMGGGINRALPLLGDEPFVVMSADVIMTYPLRQLIDKAATLSMAHLILVDHPPQNYFYLNSDHTIFLEGSPKWDYAGLGLYHPDIFKALEPGACSMMAALKPWFEKGLITGEYYSGIWYNLGTPQDYADFLEAMALCE